MPDNYTKVWLQQSLNRIAKQRAAQEIEQTGWALPCRVTAVSGSIVTVSFEVLDSTRTLPPVTIPKAEGQWIRSPTQVGDFGLTVPADALLGGISGLGTGTATLNRPVNMAALCWIPISAAGFPEVDTDAAYIAGPNGAVIKDSGSHCICTLTPTGFIITLGASTFEITAEQIALTSPTIALNGNIVQTAGAGTGAVNMVGPLTVTEGVTGAGIILQSHIHGGVTTGGGSTAAPTPGT
jgi:phage baseplate assembly protein gpV